MNRDRSVLADCARRGSRKANHSSLRPVDGKSKQPLRSSEKQQQSSQDRQAPDGHPHEPEQPHPQSCPPDDSCDFVQRHSSRNGGRTPRPSLYGRKPSGFDRIPAECEGTTGLVRPSAACTADAAAAPAALSESAAAGPRTRRACRAGDVRVAIKASKPIAPRSVDSAHAKLRSSRVWERGRNSMVECQPSKLDAAGSSPVALFGDAGCRGDAAAGVYRIFTFGPLHGSCGRSACS